MVESYSESLDWYEGSLAYMPLFRFEFCVLLLSFSRCKGRISGLQAATAFEASSQMDHQLFCFNVSVGAVAFFSRVVLRTALICVSFMLCHRNGALYQHAKQVSLVKPISRVDS